MRLKKKLIEATEGFAEGDPGRSSDFTWDRASSSLREVIAENFPYRTEVSVSGPYKGKPANISLTVPVTLHLPFLREEKRGERDVRFAVCVNGTMNFNLNPLEDLLPQLETVLTTVKQIKKIASTAQSMEDRHHFQDDVAPMTQEEMQQHFFGPWILKRLARKD